MPGEHLSVDSEGLRQFSRTHLDIASDVVRLADHAPDATGVATTHGSIGFSVQTALKELLGARQGGLQATAATGTALADMLRRAADAYSGVDEQTAQRLRDTLGGVDYPFPDITTLPVPEAPVPFPDAVTLPQPVRRAAG